LQLAVGHLPGTPLPGESGNVDLAGHRDTFFRGLKKVQKGDVVTLSTVNGDLHRYRVESISVVSPNNTEVLNEFAGPGVNLITCYPFSFVGSAPKRFVVHADEIGEASDKREGPVERAGLTPHGSGTSTQIRPVSLRSRSPISRSSNRARANHRRSARQARHSLAESEDQMSSKADEEMSSAEEEPVVHHGSQPRRASNPQPRSNRFRTLFHKVFKSNKAG